MNIRQSGLKKCSLKIVKTSWEVKNKWPLAHSDTNMSYQHRLTGQTDESVSVKSTHLEKCAQERDEKLYLKSNRCHGVKNIMFTNEMQWSRGMKEQKMEIFK